MFAVAVPASVLISADNWTISLPWGDKQRPSSAQQFGLKTDGPDDMRGSSCRNQILKNKGKKFDKVFYAQYALPPLAELFSAIFFS